MNPNPGSTLFKCLFLVGVSTPANSWVAGPSALTLPILPHKTPFLCLCNFSGESRDLWRKAGAPQLRDKKRKVGSTPSPGHQPPGPSLRLWF